MDIREWFAYRVLGVKPQIIKASPLAETIVQPGDQYGVGQDWAPTTYGEYYARSVLIYKAISMRAQSVTRPPLRIYETNGDETNEVSPDHPLPTLLNYVNGWWPKSRLWEATSTYMDLWGSAFWVLTKAGEGSLPTEIWPARPDHVKIIPSKTDYIAGYSYSQHGKTIPLRTDEVVWFSRFNPLSEYAGLSPIAPVRLSADMGLDAMKYNRAAFKGILHSNLDVQIDGTVTTEQVDEFREKLRKRHSSESKAQEPFIHGNAWKVANLGFSQREMEYLGSLRWSLEDVGRAYDIPLIMLGDLTHSTYANFEAAERMYWRGIATYLKSFAGHVTEFLCPLYGDNLTAEFDLSEIEALQADINAEREQDRQDVSTGIITINEVRAKRGDEPVAWGDDYWAPLGLAPISGGGTEESLAMARNNGHQQFKRYIPPELTEARLKQTTDNYIKRLTGQEKSFDRLQRELFDEQRADIIAKLKQHKAVKQPLTLDGLMSLAYWLPIFTNKGKPAMAAALAQNAVAQVGEFGLGIAFDVKHPLVDRWLIDRAEFWAKRVNAETGKLLMQELKEAVDAGESVKQMQERVEKVFRFNDQIRSERIARTEMVASTNKGAIEAYRQSGIVEKKVWLATVDSRTRETHLAAHMQTVPIDAPFIVGGEQMDGPGDMSGSAENVIFCRCAVAPIVSREARSLRSQRKLEVKP